MSRLTDKDCYKYEDFCFNYRNRETMQSGTDFAMYVKLKSLEDLEEELGIDLIILFKALKQKYVFHEENLKIELLGLHIKSDELYLYGFVEDTMHVVYLRLKDYGKTWTMTKEEFYKNIK